MKRATMDRKWRLNTLAVMAAVALFATTARAGGPIIHVAPEVAANGVTFEGFIVEQNELLGELTAQLPEGTGQEPVRVGITQKDRNDLSVQPPSGTAPMRIGVVKAVSGVEVVRGQAFKRGALQETENGGFVWAMRVESPNAQAIRLHFRNFSLPPNVEMYFFGEGTIVDGPYVGAGRNGNGEFWTRSIASESGFVMVRSVGAVSDTDRRQISFIVSDLGHIRGRPPQPVVKSHDSWPCSDNAPCLVDANCGNAGPAEPAKDAVAKMEWIAGAFINTCTGGLLADTDPGSSVPLFLTANHCTSKSVSNMEFFFNYTTGSCNGSCPDSLVTGGTPPAPSAVGFTVLASGRNGDYTLGQLNEAPPAGAVFLGWTNAPIANNNGAGLYRISNANFGPQVYSEHDVDTSSPTCRGWPRGERIYSTDITGATMSGSSGSPVVNASGEVVGQLSGCCGYNCGDECDSANNWTVDGALAFYYDNVAAYLDPQGGGGCTTNGDCDDGLFCNGAETCVSGSCQSGSNPCQAGETCNESTDTCEQQTCGLNKDPCNVNEDCCSLNCRNGSCKGS